MNKNKGYQKSFPLLHHGKNLLAVNATVGGTNGNVREYRLRLLVDTGSSFTILPIKPLEDLDYDINHPRRYQTITTGNGEVDAPAIQVSWLNCAGQFMENIEILAHNISPHIRVSGILGMDFLLSCRGIISVAEAKIDFQPQSSSGV